MQAAAALGWQTQDFIHMKASMKLVEKRASKLQVSAGLLVRMPALWKGYMGLPLVRVSQALSFAKAPAKEFLEHLQT